MAKAVLKYIRTNGPQKEHMGLCQCKLKRRFYHTFLKPSWGHEVERLRKKSKLPDFFCLPYIDKILAKFYGFVKSTQLFMETPLHKNTLGSTGIKLLRAFCVEIPKALKSNVHFFPACVPGSAPRNIKSSFFKCRKKPPQKLGGKNHIRIKKQEELSLCHLCSLISSTRRHTTSHYFTPVPLCNLYGRIFGSSIGNNNFHIPHSLPPDGTKELRKVFLFIERGDNNAQHKNYGIIKELDSQ